MRASRCEHETDGLPWRPLGVEAAAALLGSVSGWWLSGGQAIDRMLDRSTREHGDLDVSVLTTALPDIFEVLHGSHAIFAAADGSLSPAEGPDTAVEAHSFWVLDEEAGAWVLQVNIEPGTAESWIYRRDPRVRLPWRSAVRAVDGVPTSALAPTLLWKSKSPRPVDESDLQSTLPLLSPAELLWLRSAVATAHPDSPWKDTLRRDAEGGGPAETPSTTEWNARIRQRIAGETARDIDVLGAIDAGRAEYDADERFDRR